jgi:formate dehydrogenase iron-sulfur subunit
MDAAAVAVGADEVAAALRKVLPEAEIVRTGSRGMFWLEPLVEVETPKGRVGFGPVEERDVPALAEAIRGGGDHPLAIGRIENHSYLKRQTRLTFARCGIIDPRSLDDYRTHGGWRGLDRAHQIGPAATVEEVIASGLRGRGGAGFPTGIKWKTVAEAAGPTKYIVCNADEGDSGTFADRMIMEGDPFLIVEGMAIAGFAVGASYGYIYIRSEYPHAIRSMNAAIEAARSAGMLGRDFDMEVRVGAGAYVCGEETSLLESIEGKRGEVRAKPPLPAHVGLFGRPTVINNVLSLAAVPFILSEGGQSYADFGMGKSRGTMPIQLAGNIKYGGLFETPFGLPLGELVNDIGGGTASGRPVRAAQVGGPLGAYVPPSQFDLPFDYEAFAEAGALIGHAGVVVFDDSVDMARMARFVMQFCAAESCSKCTPCRLGSTRGIEVMDDIIAGEDVETNIALIEDLCETMKFGSLCALGGFTPYPVMSALKHWPEDFRRKAAAELEQAS